MRRRTARVGLALVVVYVVALGGTVMLRADHVRPLYDGFAPPSSYRFVDPPPFFAAGNIEPAATTETIAVDQGRGSQPAGVATPDGQFVISLGRGAVSDATDASSVRVRITPLAPSGLAPVPDGLRANGNAYRIEMSYEPRGTAVAELAQPGSLLMEIPEIGERLFVSPDGKEWSPVPARVITPRQLTMTATLRRTGYYLAATSLPELAAPPGHASRVALVVGLITAAFAFIILAGAYVVVRKRRRTA